MAAGHQRDPGSALRYPRPAAVNVLALVAGVAALWQVVPGVGDTIDATRDLRRETAADREIAPAYSLSLPPSVLRGAAAVLPPDALYTIVVGDTVPLPGALPEAIKPLLAGWLFPRRFTGDLEMANWVIAYGTPSETLGVPVRRETQVEAGVVVVEVDR
jgi:hypothetical protein